MAKLPILAIVLGVMVLVGLHAAEASISCEDVVEGLEPCLSYLEDGGDPSSSCCSSISSLNSECSTAADRQAACKCLQEAAESYSFNSKYAADLPGACGVDIGYTISSSVNCSDVE